MNKGEIKIYQSSTWIVDVQVNFDEETVWLNSYQIADIFWKDRTTIQRHIKKLYSSWELDEKTTCAENAQVQIEWWITVKRDMNLYNLDIILAIWYRTNSEKAVQFRKWATSILKDYLAGWYALNQKRLQEKWLEELEQTLNIFKNTLWAWDLSKDEAIWLLDIITKYTNSWLLLQNYDENNLLEAWKTKQIHYKLEAQEAYMSLSELKQNLIIKKQATELFANPIETNSLEWIFLNIYQTFDNKELYNSIE